METILVTGGAGFIGSHVSDTLLELGYEVVCVDNFNSSYPQKIKIRNVAHNLDNPNFHLRIKNLAYKEKVEDIFKEHKIDRVIHLAARAGVRSSIERPDLYQESNVQATINLLEVSKKHKIKNFVFASSSSVYGNSKEVPFNEEQDVNKPISPYAASKRACELFCYTYHHLFNMNITCLRFFTVYGPRGRRDMAPFIFTNAIHHGKKITMFGDGTTKRDYTYIADIVDGILKAMNKPLDFQIINLGNSDTVELTSFISLIEKVVGKKAKIETKPMVPGDVDITYADVSKAKKLLSWEPKTSIEEGMKFFYDWYKEQKD